MNIVQQVIPWVLSLLIVFSASVIFDRIGNKILIRKVAFERYAAYFSKGPCSLHAPFG
jgi:hypothetical protein